LGRLPNTRSLERCRESQARSQRTSTSQLSASSHGTEVAAWANSANQALGHLWSRANQLQPFRKPTLCMITSTFVADYSRLAERHQDQPSSPHCLHDRESGGSFAEVRRRVHGSEVDSCSRKGELFFRDKLHAALPPSIPRPRLRDQSVAQRSSVQQTKLKPSSTVSSWSTAPGETDDGTGQRHGTSDLSSVTSSSSGSSKFLGSALRWKSFLDINVDECVVLPSTAAVVCLHFYPDLPIATFGFTFVDL
jgi:hypothetical protein